MKTFVKYVLLFICFGIGVTAATAGPHDKSAEQIVGELLAAVPIDTPLVVAVPIDLVAVPINTMAEPSDSGADWVDHAAKEISKAEEAEKVGQAAAIAGCYSASAAIGGYVGGKYGALVGVAAAAKSC